MNKKILIGVGAIAILGAGYYFYTRRKRKSTTVKGGDDVMSGETKGGVEPIGEPISDTVSDADLDATNTDEITKEETILETTKPDVLQTKPLIQTVKPNLKIKPAILQTKPLIQTVKPTLKIKPVLSPKKLYASRLSISRFSGIGGTDYFDVGSELTDL